MLSYSMGPTNSTSNGSFYLEALAAAAAAAFSTVSALQEPTYTR